MDNDLGPNTVTGLSKYVQQFQPSTPFPGFDRFVGQVTDTLQNLDQFYETGTPPAPFANFNESLDAAENHLETLESSDSQDLENLTFAVAQFNRLADQVMGMYRAIA